MVRLLCSLDNDSLMHLPSVSGYENCTEYFWTGTVIQNNDTYRVADIVQTDSALLMILVLGRMNVMMPTMMLM